ncbi:nitrite reductase small subunit NirD [Hydrogenovibrio sp. JE_KL2]|jgi:nitrite reductase (NADH) small subunit|uniref:nitrite reductase small subunit NirD n=1 Tax=Hydrogenovibrio sp. JE_KL2 TaxID=2651188 RepID=UPI00128C1666|nr:nitrite reductase small subunit NirD [Hydrogenovibrio sp. JE_KL2]MBD3820782.1 nitrite reductase small subunit NirD [Thiotrichales bacterium]MBN2606014.1 nitrite reductase small subunit NirD [Thiotrichales bacterium]MPQ76985.1 nitrite reductase small subunit NirD [Hydrogenovibrio sp. JE_KL2]
MSEFLQVCSVNDLVKDAGVAALVNNKQVALFYIDGQVYAIDNYDPLGQANVMSRGMTGDRQGELTVASPLHKEHYSLISGQCLDKEGIAISVYPARVVGETVEVAVS